MQRAPLTHMPISRSLCARVTSPNKDPPPNRRRPTRVCKPLTTKRRLRRAAARAKFHDLAAESHSFAIAIRLFHLNPVVHFGDRNLSPDHECFAHPSGQNQHRSAHLWRSSPKCNTARS